MTNLTALVLCGGRGARLRALIGDLPKVLAPAAGRPFLGYVLDFLRAQGIADVILCLGAERDGLRVRAFCQDGARWNLRIVYAEEGEPLGTAGAVKHAADLIQTDPFWVLNGDSLARVDLVDQEHFHREKGAPITLALVEANARDRFGAVVLGNDGVVSGFVEKGAAGHGLVSAGIYLMNKSVLDAVPRARPASFEYDVFPHFVGKGLVGWVVAGPLVDIGTPESYAAVKEGMC